MRAVNFVLSAWVFFFRLPALTLKRFYPNAIVLAGFVQLPVFLSFALAFKGLFGLAHIAAIPYVLLGWLGLSLLSGFFHEDGLSDVADSLGVPKFSDSVENLERIKKAMIDSRLGSFGVHAAVLLWVFRYVFSIQEHALVAVSIGILGSRTAGIAVAVLESRGHAKNAEAKSSSYLREIPLWLPFLLLALVESLLVLLFSDWQAAASLLGVSACMFLFIRKLASRSGFLNGDMVGGTILVGEFLLCLALQFCDLSTSFPF